MRPLRADFVIVGAGIHGMSTAYHLAESLEEAGRAKSTIVVLEKSRIGGGATGVSGGIVRNFYLSAAMNEIVRQSVEIFEIDPALFGFHQVGYIAAVPEAQAAELAQIAAQHSVLGYPSELTLGAGAVRATMRDRFPDWRAEGVAAVLHEPRSGWADAARTLAAFTGMARTAGVKILEGVEVLGLELSHGVVTRIETSAGPVLCDTLVLAPGPWARELWPMLQLAPPPGGGDSRAFFHYLQVREGEYIHPAGIQPDAPVVHLDVDVPLVSREDDSILAGAPWGIYFRPGLGGGIACGGVPLPLALDCELDPYGPSHPLTGAASSGFDETATAGLSWALGRFEGPRAAWTCSSFAAPTCFTPDSYPVVGFVLENAYAIIDSNHGFKLLALGKLAASEIQGHRVPELEPFRLQRFATAAVHPVSASPYPWT